MGLAGQAGPSIYQAKTLHQAQAQIKLKLKSPSPKPKFNIQAPNCMKTIALYQFSSSVLYKLDLNKVMEPIVVQRHHIQIQLKV